MPPSPRVTGCVTGEKGWRQARVPCTQVICALCTVRCALCTVRALCTQVICALCAPITVTAHSSVCSVFYSRIVDCITCWRVDHHGHWAVCRGRPRTADVRCSTVYGAPSMALWWRPPCTPCTERGRPPYTPGTLYTASQSFTTSPWKIIQNAGNMFSSLKVERSRGEIKLLFKEMFCDLINNAGWFILQWGISCKDMDYKWPIWLFCW